MGVKRHHGVLVLIGALVFAVAPTTSASAAPTLTPSLGGWVAAGDTASFSFGYSGATGGDAIVTMELADGTMSVDDSGLALSLQPGSVSFTGVTKVSFTGSLADVTTALANRLTWTAPATPAESYLRLTVSVGSYIDGLISDPGSGHYYLLSAGTLSWPDARDAAAAQNYNGLTGYLATITSATENNFLTTETGGVTAYFAATSEILYVNPLLDPADRYTDESQLRNVYYWGSGPEAGQLVTFRPWFPGEPNGTVTDRCLLTNWFRPMGEWNDSPCSVPYRYLVEFGGIGTETGPAAFDNLSAAPPAHEPALAATGVETSLLGVAGMIAMLLGFGMLFVGPWGKRAGRRTMR